MEEDKTKEKHSFKDGVRGVWRYVRPHKGVMIALMFLGLVSAAANGFVPYVTGRFFDALIGVSHGQAALVAGIPAWEALLIVWAATQFVANAVDWIIDRMQRHFNTNVEFEMQVKGFLHFLRLPLSYHTNAHMNGELSKMSSASWRVSSIIRTVVQVVPQMVSVVIGITLAISINPILASILAAGVVVYIIALIPMLLPIAAADHAAHKAWNDNWDNAASAVMQVSTVKQAAAEAYEQKKTAGSLMGTTRALWLSIQNTWSNIGSFQRMIVFFTQLAVFIVSVQFVATGVITVGELIALNGYSMLFFGPFVALGYSWQVVQNGLTSAASLEKVMQIPEENYHPVGAQAPAVREGRVSFEQVGFQYEDEKGGILSDLSFSTEPGEVVALVGESGSGKSTAISLISGYYFPHEGRVLVDGVDTREWDLTELRKGIAIVPQEVALFNESLRANIRYGAFDATDEEIEEAAKQAHIDEFINTLPQKFDTVVGERGIKLSVGQKQRIAIARAILRNPGILILDEPTSALDSKTEHLITESLQKLMQGRTTFIIAHRLSTVRKADKILVLDKGSIVEQGSHQELMEIENGTYRRLYELHIGLSE